MAMYNNKFNPTKFGQVDGEKYLDSCITAILELTKDLTANGQTFDLDTYLRLKRHLTLQLENVAIAAGKIKPIREKVDEEDYSEHQLALRDYLVNYFKEENPDLGIGAFPKAKSVMKFIFEGSYATKIDRMQESLKDKLESSDSKIHEAAESYLDNYKFQVILQSAISAKPHRIEVQS